MEILVHQIVSVDMNSERAEQFLRFAQNEAFYGLMWSELSKAKPEEIKNGWIKILLKQGEKPRVQRFDETT